MKLVSFQTYINGEGSESSCYIYSYFVQRVTAVRKVFKKAAHPCAVWAAFNRNVKKDYFQVMYFN